MTAAVDNQSCYARPFHAPHNLPLTGAFRIVANLSVASRGYQTAAAMFRRVTEVRLALSFPVIA